MIARMWMGEVRAVDLDAYTEVLDRTGRTDALATEGNRGVLLLRRVEAERGKFVFISLWDSMAAVEAFAGAEPERARYYPEDREYLLSFPDRVEHFEVMD